MVSHTEENVWPHRSLALDPPSAALALIINVGIENTASYRILVCIVSKKIGSSEHPGDVPTERPRWLRKPVFEISF